MEREEEEVRRFLQNLIDPFNPPPNPLIDALRKTLTENEAKGLDMEELGVSDIQLSEFLHMVVESLVDKAASRSNQIGVAVIGENELAYLATIALLAGIEYQRTRNA